MKRREFISATLAGSATLSLSNSALAATGAAADIPAVRLSGAATVLEKAALIVDTRNAFKGYKSEKIVRL